MLSVEEQSKILQEEVAFRKEQTPATCLAIVKRAGWMINHVKEQTPELCAIAVAQDPRYLRYVREQTPELCQMALKRRPLTLDDVREQTREICLYALECDHRAIWLVKDPALRESLRLYCRLKGTPLVES